jgi:transposase InsO family protein
VKANRADYRVATICRVLEVSRSGYYAWLKREPSVQDKANAALLKVIKDIHKESDKTYGAPRVHAELQDRGPQASLNRVARVMKKAELRGVSPRKWKCTTLPGKRTRAVPDLVDRDFTATGPDQLWVADITYISTWAGFLFLAIVLDVWSRRIVGWAMATHLRTELVLDALDMALARRSPHGVIHHSDHGCQGGFNRSSQHHMEVWRWDRRSVEPQIERCVNRFFPQDGLQSDGESTELVSGKGSLVGCRVRRQRLQPACLSLSVAAGFANVVACHLSAFAPLRGGTYRSSSVRRSPFSEPVAVACVRSLHTWGVHRPRSLGSCAGTRPHGRAASSIAPPRPSGTLIGERSVQRLPNSLRIPDSGSTFRIALAV